MHSGGDFGAVQTESKMILFVQTFPFGVILSGGNGG